MSQAREDLLMLGPQALQGIRGRQNLLDLVGEEEVLPAQFFWGRIDARVAARAALRR